MIATMVSMIGEIVDCHVINDYEQQNLGFMRWLFGKVITTLIMILMILILLMIMMIDYQEAMAASFALRFSRNGWSPLKD